MVHRDTGAEAVGQKVTVRILGEMEEGFCMLLPLRKVELFVRCRPPGPVDEGSDSDRRGPVTLCAASAVFE